MVRGLGAAALALLLGLTSAKARAEDAILRFTMPRYSAGTEGYLARWGKDFNAAVPGAEVKATLLDLDRLRPILQSEIDAGSNPDLAVIGAGWLAELARDGALMPLDSRMSAEFRSRFIGSFLQPGTVGGKLYGLPVAASAYALFSNADLLARGGIKAPPATLDALLADALRLKAAGVHAFGLPGRGEGAATLWYCGLWSRGGELLDRDGRAAFASPAGVDALSDLRVLASEGGTEDAPDTRDAAEVEAMFVHGEVAMALGAPALVERLARDAPNLSYSVSAVPQETRPATFATADEMVAFSHSQLFPAGFSFMNYLFTRAPRLAFVKAERMLPTTGAVARDKYFTKNERLSAFTKLLPTAHFAPTVVGWDIAAAALSDAVHSALTSQTSSEAVLAGAAARADAALAR